MHYYGQVLQRMRYLLYCKHNALCRCESSGHACHLILAWCCIEGAVAASEITHFDPSAPRGAHYALHASQGVRGAALQLLPQGFPSTRVRSRASLPATLLYHQGHFSLGTGPTTAPRLHSLRTPQPADLRRALQTPPTTNSCRCRAIKPPPAARTAHTCPLCCVPKRVLCHGGHARSPRQVCNLGSRASPHQALNKLFPNKP